MLSIQLKIKKGLKMAEDFDKSVFRNDNEALTRDEQLDEIVVMLNIIAPDLLDNMDDFTRFEKSAYITNVLANREGFTFTPDADSDIIEAFNLLSTQIEEEDMQLNTIISRIDFKDILSYQIYLNINIIPALEGDMSILTNDLTTMDLIHNLTAILKDANNADATPIPEDTLMETFISLESRIPGITEEVLNVYKNNPMVKYRDELEEHKNNLANYSDEELDEHFIGLLSTDNKAALVSITNYIRYALEDNSYDEEKTNLNHLYSNDTIGELSKRYDSPEYPNMLLKHILGLLARVNNTPLEK